jgi:phytoene desaturase
VRVVVVGAGVGGLAAAVRLAYAGHDVTVVDQAAAAGGKAGRWESDGFAFDTGPSLLTMPWVFEELFADTGAPLRHSGVELVRVEPVTRYRFADGSTLCLSADLPASLDALEAWSPGAGSDWVRFLGTCAAMWRASVPFLSGPPPWPPRMPAAGAAAPDPRDFLRVRPWHTLRTLARAQARDPRLRMVIERFATYAGADPRRAPAALAVAGYVEHAFGAWHVRGGIHRLVTALEGRLRALGGELRCDTRVDALLLSDGRARGVGTAAGPLAGDAVVWSGDGLVLDRLLGRPTQPEPERSLSGFALMLGLRGRTTGLVHHAIEFPADYDAEFDDVFVARRLVRDPTLYVSASCASDPSQAPAGAENWFVLVNAPSGVDFAEAELDAYAARLVARLGIGERVVVHGRRTPADLERETGAARGAIYGAAPHGRLGTLRRPGPVVRGVGGLFRAGGTAHPGGGLPLVALGGRIVADLIGPASSTAQR